ncbi:MAG: hypothetical protein ACE5H3_10415 [Planctomycetota bacterium]
MLVAATLLLGLAGPGPLTFRFPILPVQAGKGSHQGKAEGKNARAERKPGKPQEGEKKGPKGQKKEGFSNEDLQAWYEKSEAVFQDEDAVRRGREILQKSLEFHDWNDFQKSGE